ncbi:MAG: hypothetical protein FWG64_12910 [Firmicutes bacterium]|nr:hypothetical protein [Bacillota bacterium]
MIPTIIATIVAIQLFNMIAIGLTENEDDKMLLALVLSSWAFVLPIALIKYLVLFIKWALNAIIPVKEHKK